MAEALDELTARVHRIEVRLDGMDRSLIELSVSIDRRFDEIRDALVEQRQYTEFAFTSLEKTMMARFEQVDARFEQVDARFDRVDARLDRVDARLDRIDERFEQFETRFDTMDARFSRVERKLDQFIDTQTRANALVERRLRLLERPS